MTLTDWVDRLTQELGLDLKLDLDEILDLARDAAHGVDRPAAPLTTFLVGYAAAQRGGGPAEVTRCAQAATALVATWDPDGAQESPSPGG